MSGAMAQAARKRLGVTATRSGCCSGGVTNARAGAAHAHKMSGASLECDYFRRGVCRSCAWLEVPYAEQIARKQAIAAEALAPFVGTHCEIGSGHSEVEAGRGENGHGERASVCTSGAASPGIWEQPWESVPASFRNKVKLVVTGTVKAPKLGILANPRTGAGADLRECPLPTLGIRAAIPALAEFVRRARLQPYNMRTDTGVLKYLIVTEAPAGGGAPGNDAPARGGARTRNGEGQLSNQAAGSSEASASSGQNALSNPSPEGSGLMVRFVVRRRGAQGAIFKHYAWLREALPMLRVCSINLQPEHKAIIEGSEEILVSAEGLLPMPLVLRDAGSDSERQLAMSDGGHQLTLFSAPQSFFQTNSEAAAQLYRRAQEWLGDALRNVPAGASGHAPENQLASSALVDQPADALAAGALADKQEYALAGGTPPANGHERGAAELRTVWDLYCGVGGFGLAVALADPRVRVASIESSASAVASAEAAAGAAALAARASFVASDALEWARAQQASRAALPDAVIVNPPRRGIGAPLAQWLNHSGIPLILYSSCNIHTMAADLSKMPEYAVTRAQVVDMFPHTEHFETITLLARRSA